MNKIVSWITIVVLFLIVGVTGCTAKPIPTPSEEDYLSALEGLTVTTTSIHPEVVPPPPGMRYPPTFYEPMLIGRVPPDITGSVALAPYGQPYDWADIKPDWFREGQTLDILLEANKPVLWQLDKPDAVAVYADFGMMISAGTIGLLDVWGFFYESVMTETQTEGQTSERKYSTSLRVIAWEDGNLELKFRNFSPEAIEVSYSIWRGGFVSNFVNDYGGAWEKYWESSEVKEEEILKLKRDMEKYLRDRWH